MSPRDAATLFTLACLAVGGLLRSCRIDAAEQRLDALEAVPCSAPSRGPVGVLPEGS